VISASIARFQAFARGSNNEGFLIDGYHCSEFWDSHSGLESLASSSVSALLFAVICGTFRGNRGGSHGKSDSPRSWRHEEGHQVPWGRNAIAGSIASSGRESVVMALSRAKATASELKAVNRQ
jgi:hypothetical protein